VSVAGAATCPQCGGPMPERKSKGRPARFCEEACRKSAHRAAQAELRAIADAKVARARLPRLRRFLDESLDEVEAAARRLHASGLDPDELMLRPGAKRELPGDVEYSLRHSLERLRSAAREHREAVETSRRHPPAPGSEDDDQEGGGPWTK
jgi:hypothetical protein